MPNRNPHPQKHMPARLIEDSRRDELCLQLAENLHDLGASEFSRELRAGDGKFLISVVRSA
jgi:hypothetical protein